MGCACGVAMGWGGVGWGGKGGSRGGAIQGRARGTERWSAVQEEGGGRTDSRQRQEAL